MKKSLSVILIIILFVFSFSSVKAEEVTNTKTLTVAFPEINGFSMTDSEGNHSGIVFDFLIEIAKYTNWEYQFITGENEQIISDFRNGQYDLCGTMYYSETFVDEFEYPNYSTGNTKAFLFSLWENETISGYNIEDLNGKKIGVNANATENIRRLKAYLDQKNVTCEIISYDNSQKVDGNLYYYLENKEVDVLLGNAVDNTGRFRKVASFDSQPHFIVVKKDCQDVLDQLNDALSKIYDADPNFAEELYQKYLPDDSTAYLLLNSNEKNYVTQKQKIKVAIPRHCHPFHHSAEDSNINKGITLSILDKIKEFSNLDYELEITDTYYQAINLVATGQADVLGYFSGTELDAKALGLKTTKDFATLTDAMVLNHKVKSLTEDLKCGIVKGMTLPDNINYQEVIEYDTLYLAVKDVEKGKIDVAYGIGSQIDSIMQENGFYDIHISSVSNSCTISFAINRNADDSLLTIMNKGINNIPTSIKEMITNANIVYTSTRDITIRDFIASNPLVSIAFIVLFFFIVVIIIVVFFLIKTRYTKIYNESKQIEEINNIKTRFLSQISHEIRTPMNGIIGMIEIGKYNINNPEKIKECFDKVEQSSNQLLSLINDILDMSRIVDDKLEIKKQKMDLGDLLKSLISSYYLQTKDKNIRFDAKLDENLSEYIIGDSLRIYQILMNLLSNAVKFTKEGGEIIFQVEQITHQEKTKLVFTVSDTGKGIEKENISKIFESFTQENSSITREYEGTGLGLSITKNLVELMKGTISVESTVNVGSTFTVEIPLKELVPNKYKNIGHNQKVLVIKVANASCTLASILEKIGFKTTVVLNEENPTLQFEEGTWNHFDYCFLCIHSQKNEETIKQLKTKLKKDCPIIIMGYDGQQLNDCVYKYDADDMINLPTFPKKLIQFFERDRSEREMITNISILEGRRVLVVDDNYLNRRIAYEMLSKAGALVDVVESGKDAIDKFVTSKENYYDLILMDTQMPDMDGYITAQLIRKSPRIDAEQVIIISISANSLDSDIKKVYESGMNGHVSKPFVLKDIVKKYQQIISKYQK